MIVTKMALQLKDKNNVIIGVPLVKPNDNFFWFGKPRFVLNLLHLTLFVVLDLHTVKFNCFSDAKSSSNRVSLNMVGVERI